MSQHSKPDHAYIEFGRPDGRKSRIYHDIGYGLNIEWLDCGDLHISETHMSLLVSEAAKMMPDGQMSIKQRFRACSHDTII